MTDEKPQEERFVPIDGSFMCQCFERPPVWEEVMRQFQIDVTRTVFTFGDVIFTPSRSPISPDFVRHEEVHAEQQGHTPEGAGRWWARYFQDPWFRIDQEARAFAVQYDMLCVIHKDRNRRAAIMVDLSRRLAAPTYGTVVNTNGARDLIKKFSKRK